MEVPVRARRSETPRRAPQKKHRLYACWSPFRELRRKNIAKHKPQIGRAFGEAADKPGIPIRAVGHQYDGTIAFARQAFLLGALDAIEHLHFEAGFRVALLAYEIPQTPNEGDIVGAKSGAGAL